MIHAARSANQLHGGSLRRHLSADSGSALVIVLLALLLVSAVGAAMIILATSDTLAAANQRDARVVLCAAEAAIEQAADEVVTLPNWDAVLSGAVNSVRVDGPPAGVRSMPDGRVVVLNEIANSVSCGQPAGCTAAALGAATDDRRWGPNNPRWRLFAYGPGGGAASPTYSIVLVGDDPMESDGDPDRDGTPGSPGGEVLLLRAEAFGPDGSRRIVEAVVSRGVIAGGGVAPRFLSWRTVG